MSNPPGSVISELEALGLGPGQLPHERRVAVRDVLYQDAIREGVVWAQIEYIHRDLVTGEPARSTRFQREWLECVVPGAQLIVRMPIEHGKTTTALHLLTNSIGRRPRTNYAIVSATGTGPEGQARKRVNAARKILESERYRACFPELRPGKPWGDSALTVEVEGETPPNDPTPTLQGFGLDSEKVGGDRITGGLLVDNLLTTRNTRTRMQRQKTIEFLEGDFFSRLAQDAWTVFIDPPRHVEDAICVLPKRKRSFVVKRYKTTVDCPLWPEKRGVEWIRKMEERLGPVEADCQLHDNPLSEATTYFKQRFFEAAFRAARDAAEEYNCHHGYPSDPYMGGSLDANRDDGWDETYFAGVDLSTGEARDLTAIAVWAVHPRSQIRLAYMVSGLWEIDQVVEEIIVVWRLFRCLIRIEKHGQQAAYIQRLRTRVKADPTLHEMLRDIGSFDRSDLKTDPEVGIPKIAYEMAVGHVLIPHTLEESGGELVTVLEPEVEAWVSECRAWKPGDHPGDRLMATWFPFEDCLRWLDSLGGGSVADAGEETAVSGALT